MKDNFFVTVINDLGRICPNIFDLRVLKNELSVFYCTSAFRGKSPHELIKYLKVGNLDQTFKQIVRLASLIATIPATVASVEKAFPGFKNNSYQRKNSTQSKDLWIEKSFFVIDGMLELILKEKGNFYNLFNWGIRHKKIEFCNTFYKWSGSIGFFFFFCRL